MSALGVHRVTVVLSAVLRYLVTQPPAPASLVFADPPYATTQDELTETMRALTSRGWLAAGGRLLVERSSRSVEPAWPDGVARLEVRRYGETTVWHATASG